MTNIKTRVIINLARILNHHKYYSTISLLCQHHQIIFLGGNEMYNTNTDIRAAAKENGVFLYEICEKLKISEPTLTRKLRKELSVDEKARFLQLIAEISVEKKCTA